MSTSVILELQAAMGGDDAAKFVGELRRAYLRGADRAG
jgi:protein subunit release factor A